MSHRSAYLSNNNLYSTDPQCGRSWNQACKSDWQDGGYASEQECKKDCKNSFRNSPAMAAEFESFGDSNDYARYMCAEGGWSQKGYESYDKCHDEYQQFNNMGSQSKRRAPVCPSSQEQLEAFLKNDSIGSNGTCFSDFGNYVHSIDLDEDYDTNGCGLAQAGAVAKYYGLEMPENSVKKENADACNQCEMENLFPVGSEYYGSSPDDACSVYAPPSDAPSSD